MLFWEFRHLDADYEIPVAESYVTGSLMHYDFTALSRCEFFVMIHFRCANGSAVAPRRHMRINRSFTMLSIVTQRFIAELPSLR